MTPMTLPAMSSPDPGPFLLPDREGERSAPDRALLHIVVADDEPVIRQSVARVLRMRGHEVREAGSACEAIGPGADAPQGGVDAGNEAGPEFPDVLIVDWQMPGTGKAVVEHYLGRPDFEGRIILLTGSVDDGASPYRHRGVVQMRKPFSYPALVALVEGGNGA
jgi:CheY-like chemotaxis protein